MRERVTRDDLQPLEDSELAWRWGSGSHVILPPDVREQISALRPVVAQALRAKAHDLCCDEAGKMQIIAADRDAFVVSRELAQLGINPSEEVIIHWGASVAVLTHWDIVRTWWSEFCYPRRTM